MSAAQTRRARKRIRLQYGKVNVAKMKAMREESERKKKK